MNMKTKFKEILRKIGFIPTAQCACETSRKFTIEDLDSLIEPEPTKKYTYDQYCIDKGYTQTSRYSFQREYWNKYWADCCAAEYNAFYLAKAAKYPKALQSFLYAFGTYDWEKVREFMEDTNWFWRDNKVSPTIGELQLCTISLFQNLAKELNDEEWVKKYGNSAACESGGFKVQLTKTNNEYETFISFDYSMD